MVIVQLILFVGLIGWILYLYDLVDKQYGTIRRLENRIEALMQENEDLFFAQLREQIVFIKKDDIQ